MLLFTDKIKLNSNFASLKLTSGFHLVFCKAIILKFFGKNICINCEEKMNHGELELFCLGLSKMDHIKPHFSP